MTLSVLVFDSGFGGLSVALAIRKRLPKAAIGYLADNAKFPYGTLPDEVLIDRVCALIHRAVNVYQPDIIVIACNTASTLVLDKLRAQISTPIVGVVPAIKPAAAITTSGHIGLLATKGTVQRQYTDNLIQQFAPSAQVHRIGSEALVRLAQAPQTTPDRANTIIQRELTPWLTPPLAQQIDVVVLACTHFPLLKQQIQNTLGAHVKLLDSGDAIARRVAHLACDLIPAVKRGRFCTAAFTDLAQVDIENQRWLAQFGFTQMEAFNE